MKYVKDGRSDAFFVAGAVPADELFGSGAGPSLPLRDLSEIGF
jgi:hypothetical protein